jgi:hypothetical protein
MTAIYYNSVQQALQGSDFALTAWDPEPDLSQVSMHFESQRSRISVIFDGGDFDLINCTLKRGVPLNGYDPIACQEISIQEEELDSLAGLLDLVVPMPAPTY